jgi:hypothetical protein
MYIVPIPPFCLADRMVSKYRLLMPQFEGLEAVQAEYTIVDNGVFEGYDPDPDTVYYYARAFGAQEMILPDVMGDRKRTVKQTRNWLKNAPSATDINFVPVIQGSDLTDALECFELFRRVWPFMTYAIPKVLGSVTRLAVARVILSQGFDVHYLGWSNDWSLSEIRVAREAGVRSMDTSAPFVAAHFGLDVESDSVNIPRPKNYFDLPVEAFDFDLAMRNLDKMAKA